MAIQLSVAVRNARLDSIETTAGTSAILRLRSGAAPANCGTADSGTILAEIACPSDWLNAAASGSKTLSGTWQDPAANAAGTVGHFRLYDSSGTVCHLQGSVTITGGGGDMTLDNNVLAVGQVINITSFTLTDGNA